MRIVAYALLAALCAVGASSVLYGQVAQGTVAPSARESSEPEAELDYEQLQREYPLHWALTVKDYNEASRLIPLTADLNALDPTGKTPLTVATEDESADAFDMVEALLRMGADPALADSRGLSPLHYAARAGTLSVVHLLVDQYGGDVDIRPAENSPYFGINPILTPLHLAYEKGHSRIVDFLEQRGSRLPDEIAEEARTQARLVEVFNESLNRLGSEVSEMSDGKSREGIAIAMIEAIRTVSEESGMTAREKAILDEYLSHLYESRNNSIPEGMKLSEWVVSRYQSAAEHVIEKFGVR